MPDSSLVNSRVGRLFQPVDIASLVFFRVAFGSLMAIESVRYLVSDRIGTKYLHGDFRFSYFGFDWVQPWPGYGLYIHFVLLGILALAMALGFFYRLAPIFFSLDSLIFFFWIRFTISIITT